MSSDQKVLTYFKQFEESFPNIVDLFKTENVQQVISNLIDHELLPLSNDYDPRSINPFDELLADALEDPGGLYYQYLANLDGSLECLIPETEKKSLSFRSTYKSMWKLKNKDKNQFWERYNELDVLHWVVEKGGPKSSLRGIEVDPNKMNSTTIDFEAVIVGAIIYGEIVSQSELGYRGTHRKLKKELYNCIKNEVLPDCYINISFQSFRTYDRDGREEYINKFRQFLKNRCSVGPVFGDETNKEYIISQLREEGACSFPYPTGTTDYDFWITIRLKEYLTEIFPMPNDNILIDKTENNVYKKLYHKRKGKLKAFPEGEINLLIICIARYHDMMWKFHKYDNLDEHFFQRLRIKIEKVLDKKISGHIIRTIYYDSKDETLKHFSKVYLNPTACRPIPKLVFDALSK
ncbi:MAG: hypothetical protein IIA61_05400 [Candidatus Marinimicrobia bacterium]|nr:hypothetical protein [Candidatus Neomarinimicrobiota bacterium]